jgi:hypothetical protein
MGTVDVFADVGMTAFEERVLPDALRELDVRLQIVGAGGLVAQLMQLEFTEPRAGDKRDPKPVPTPKPPPRPKPPKGQAR